MVLLRAVLLGLFIAIVGEMALAVVYLANLFLLPGVPWGVAPAAVFMVLFWRHLAGVGRSPEEARERRELLRAGRLGRRGWAWAGAAIAAALVGLRSLASLLPAAAPAALLPQLPLARLGEHDVTLWAIFVTNYLLFAPLIEEAAFRGYMQVPIEQGYGPWVAVAVVAAVFALLHAGRGMPLIYLALAVFLGSLAYRAGTIWPGVLAHGAVNLWALFPGWRLPLGPLAPAAAATAAAPAWAAAGLTGLCALLAAAALGRLGAAVAATAGDR
jgi:membrane protease YdiL (CAAX protease family)